MSLFVGRFTVTTHLKGGNLSTPRGVASLSTVSGPPGMAVLEGARLLDPKKTGECDGLVYWDGEHVTLPKAVGDLQLGDQKHHFESPGRELFVRFCVSISIYEDSTHPSF